MKTITHFYSKGLNWIDVIAKAREVEVTGNFIKADNEDYCGTHFAIPIEDDITAFLVDAKYKQDVITKYNYGNGDFVGFYFYLTNTDIDFSLEDKETLVGELDYNLAIVDSEIDTDYTLKKGTRIFAVCIFINKSSLKKYFGKSTKLLLSTNVLFDSEKNAFFNLGRMGINSLILINDFRKIPYSSSLYDVYFKGLVYGLLGNCVDRLKSGSELADMQLSRDIRNIIASKALLLSIIEAPFPGVDFLAKQVAMSRSKYKNLFIKISGVSPGTYFYNNKLNRAKELLETREFTVNEVADKLNYSTTSYLAKRFYERYGIFPKQYQSLF
jgi:AraC-like DNA-binding protein